MNYTPPPHKRVVKIDPLGQVALLIEYPDGEHMYWAAELAIFKPELYVYRSRLGIDFNPTADELCQMHKLWAERKK